MNLDTQLQAINQGPAATTPPTPVKAAKKLRNPIRRPRASKGEPPQPPTLIPASQAPPIGLIAAPVVPTTTAAEAIPVAPLPPTTLDLPVAAIVQPPALPASPRSDRPRLSGPPPGRFPGGDYMPQTTNAVFAPPPPPPFISAVIVEEPELESAPDTPVKGTEVILIPADTGDEDDQVIDATFIEPDPAPLALFAGSAPVRRPTTYTSASTPTVIQQVVKPAAESRAKTSAASLHRIAMEHIGELEDELEETQINLADARAQANQAIEDRDQAVAALIKAKTNLATTVEQREQLNRQVIEAQKNTEKTGSQLEDYQHQITKLSEELEATKIELAELQTLADAAIDPSELDALQSEADQARKEATDWRNQADNAVQQTAATWNELHNVKKNLTEAEATIAAQTQREMQLKAQIDELANPDAYTAELAQLESELSAVNQALAATRAELDHANHADTKSGAVITELQEQISALTTEKESANTLNAQLSADIDILLAELERYQNLDNTATQLPADWAAALASHHDHLQDVITAAIIASEQSILKEVRATRPRHAIQYVEAQAELPINGADKDALNDDPVAEIIELQPIAAPEWGPEDYLRAPETNRRKPRRKRILTAAAITAITSIASTGILIDRSIAANLDSLQTQPVTTSAATLALTPPEDEPTTQPQPVLPNSDEPDMPVIEPDPRPEAQEPAPEDGFLPEPTWTDNWRPGDGPTIITPPPPAPAIQSPTTEANQPTPAVTTPGAPAVTSAAQPVELARSVMTVTCDVTGDVVLTATGLGQVTVQAGGLQATGENTAELRVRAEPVIRAQATAPTEVRLDAEWQTEQGECRV